MLVNLSLGLCFRDYCFVAFLFFCIINRFLGTWLINKFTSIYFKFIFELYLSFDKRVNSSTKKFDIIILPSEISLSRISQAKMVGFSLLYCSILATTAGVATFGLLPPIRPGGRRVPGTHDKTSFKDADALVKVLALDKIAR